MPKQLDTYKLTLKSDLTQISEHGSIKPTVCGRSSSFSFGNYKLRKTLWQFCLRQQFEPMEWDHCFSAVGPLFI